MKILEYCTLHPKIILLGEYSILLGGDALTFPLKNYSAQFDFMDNTSDFEAAIDSNKRLRGFADFIAGNNILNTSIQIKELKADLSDGIYLQSNIPYGYGLGSSGMVCAAIAKTYSMEPSVILNTDKKLKELLTFFSVMESYFHTQSSGIDPLACFIGKPLFLNDNGIKIIPSLTLRKNTWFLLDTGSPRNTSELVTTFKQNLTNPHYKQELENNYLPLVHEFISNFNPSGQNTANEEISTRSLIEFMETISILQLQYFGDMIPKKILPLWQQGIETSRFYLKLLGAGGGGYMLGYTDFPEEIPDLCNAHGFQVNFLNP